MHKKTLIIISVAVIIIILVGVGIFASRKPSVPSIAVVPAVTISMTKDGFSPNESSIKLGQAVMFKNETQQDFFWPASDLHPTHELYPEFDPRMPIGPGESWMFVFERVGTWAYHDHLFARKKGLVTVSQ